ncbi:restriction endonuclease subunit S [Enterococcus casseliflavus]|uniref:restriction endonuclease subunit S n=1 Tax=Enterococcus casseliflavus TaxID=37734 RepID=UPI0034D17476
MNAQDLKNSILQLAIQGKLVEQREEEGTAKELLNKIEAEKKQLIKDKVIKRQKSLPEITEEEIDFDIPESWEWARLESLTYSIGNKSNQIKQSEILQEGLYPVVSQSMNRIEGYSNEEKKLLRIKPLSVIVFGDHSKTLKLIDFDFIIGADGTKIMVPISLDPEYLFYVLSYNVINMKDRGYSRHFQFLKERLVPLPPLEEQKRIVAKIEELMPYVDKYDVAYSEVEELNKKFPEDMQKSILQYAIQGKLVEQREEDGTAEELYKQIQEDMKKQIKEGKVKKTKKLPAIKQDEIPFDIPENWKWVRLGEIGFTNIGLTYKPSDISSNGTIVLRSSNIQNGKLDYNDLVKVSKDIPMTKMCQIGDILICARNGSKRLVGKSALIDKDGMSFGAFMAIYRSVCNEYILNIINSAYFRNTMLPETGTTTINQITQETLRYCMIPLPPLEEQKRILGKIELLLPYTKQLEKKVD